MLVTTIVYVVATVAIMGIIPVGALASSASPFADAAGKIFGRNAHRGTGRAEPLLLDRGHYQ